MPDGLFEDVFDDLLHVALRLGVVLGFLDLGLHDNLRLVGCFDLGCFGVLLDFLVFEFCLVFLTAFIFDDLVEVGLLCFVIRNSDFVDLLNRLLVEVSDVLPLDFGCLRLVRQFAELGVFDSRRLGSSFGGGLGLVFELEVSLLRLVFGYDRVSSLYFHK